MKNLRKTIPFIIITTLVLTACGVPSVSLDATSWRLESYRDIEGNMVDALPDSVSTALFQADQLSGSAGCNNYSTSYETDGTNISFGPAASTLKSCVTPEGIMQQESAFLMALSSAKIYAIDNSSLVLKDDQGEVLLTFAKQ